MNPEKKSSNPSVAAAAAAVGYFATPPQERQQAIIAENMRSFQSHLKLILLEFENNRHLLDQLLFEIIKETEDLQAGTPLQIFHKFLKQFEQRYSFSLPANSAISSSIDHIRTAILSQRSAKKAWSIATVLKSSLRLWIEQNSADAGDSELLTNFSYATKAVKIASEAVNSIKETMNLVLAELETKLVECDSAHTVSAERDREIVEQQALAETLSEALVEANSKLTLAEEHLAVLQKELSEKVEPVVKMTMQQLTPYFASDEKDAALITGNKRERPPQELPPDQLFEAVKDQMRASVRKTPIVSERYPASISVNRAALIHATAIYRYLSDSKQYLEFTPGQISELVEIYCEHRKTIFDSVGYNSATKRSLEYSLSRSCAGSAPLMSAPNSATPSIMMEQEQEFQAAIRNAAKEHLHSSDLDASCLANHIFKYLEKNGLKNISIITQQTQQCVDLYMEIVTENFRNTFTTELPIALEKFCDLLIKSAEDGWFPSLRM